MGREGGQEEAYRENGELISRHGLLFSYLYPLYGFTVTVS